MESLRNEKEKNFKMARKSESSMGDGAQTSFESEGGKVKTVISTEEHEGMGT